MVIRYESTSMKPIRYVVETPLRKFNEIFILHREISTYLYRYPYLGKEQIVFFKIALHITYSFLYYTYR